MPTTRSSTKPAAPEPTMQTAARAFLSSPSFAVAGASSNPAKYGHILFTWYLSHSLPVTPLNPSSPSITIPSHPQPKSYATVPSPSALPHPGQTALSIVTPPAVTSKVLKEARDAGVRAVWLQPGSFGEEELAYAEREWPGRAVGGFGEGTRGGEGWCLLVDGEAAMRGREKM